MAALHWLIHTRSPHSSIKRLFLFFLPSSVLFFLFLFSHVGLSSPHHRGMGDNETPGSPRPFWGPFRRGDYSLQFPHLLSSMSRTSSTHCFCFGGRMLCAVQQVVVVLFNFRGFSVSCSCCPPMCGCLLLCFIKGQFGVTKAVLSLSLYDLIIKYFFTEYETEITFNAIMRERQ